MLFDILKGNVGLDYILSHIAVIILMIFLILPVHEFAHAGMAYLLGDKSIKYRGRLSLNPLKHIDIMGALCMLLLGFGWAKPVPINPGNFKKPKLYMGLTALAGPVSNILCGMLGGALMLFMLHFTPVVFSTGVGSFIFYFLYYYVNINASLAVFNLLPIPPLDGSKVMFIFLPNKAVEFCYRYQSVFFILIYVLILSGSLSGVLGTLTSFLVKLCFFFTL